MIHIEVDYQGSIGEKIYSFVSTDDKYISQLDEIANYDGKIDGIQVSIGSDVARDVVFDQYPRQVLFKTTNVGVAIRRAKRIKYFS